MTDQGNGNELAAELEQLQQSAPQEVRHAVQRLQAVAGAERPPYPPELTAAVADLVRNAAARISAGEPADEVLDNPGIAFEQQLSAETVNNAQTIFNVLVGDRPRAPQAPQAALAPIVLAVVTEAQASELVDGTAFDNYPSALRQDFAQFDTLLTEQALGDWRDRYGDSATEWRPFGGEMTIADLVTKIVSDANETFNFAPPLAPELLDIAAVSEDRRRLRTLRSDGCVVIVDSLSMRHPAVQRALHHSLLDAYPSTSVVVVAPTHNVFEPTRCLGVVLQLRIQDLELAKRRLDLEEEVDACTETAEQRVFESWVVRQVRRLAPQMGAKTGIRAHMQFGAE
jgi:hypothetical protein